jgi:hypothetical protein
MPIEIRFTTRLTPCSCTVTMTTPMRTQTKRFRKGYACSELSAKRWIEEQIDAYREYAEICKSAGRETPKRLFFINDIPVN